MPYQCLLHSIYMILILRCFAEYLRCGHVIHKVCTVCRSFKRHKHRHFSKERTVKETAYQLEWNLSQFTLPLSYIPQRTFHPLLGCGACSVSLNCSKPPLEQSGASLSTAEDLYAQAA